MKKLEAYKLKADKLNQEKLREEKLKEDKLEADKLEGGKIVQIAPSVVTFETNQTSIKMNIELCITGNRDVLPNIFINQSPSNPNVISIAMEPKNDTLSLETIIKQENVIKNELKETLGISSAVPQLTAASNVSQSTIPVVPQLTSTSVDPRITNAPNFRQVNVDSGPDSGSDMPIKQENIFDDDIVILPSESSVAAASSQVKIIQNETQNTSFVRADENRDSVRSLNLRASIEAKNLNNSAKLNNVPKYSKATDEAENPSQEIKSRNTSNTSDTLRSENNINSNTTDNANFTLKTENPETLVGSNSEEHVTIIDLCDDDLSTLENGDFAEMNDQTLLKSLLETTYNIHEPTQSDNMDSATHIEIMGISKKPKKKNKEKKKKKEKKRKVWEKVEKQTEKNEKIEEKKTLEDGEINSGSESTIGAEESLKDVKRKDSEKESILVDCKDSDNSDKNKSTFKKDVRMSDKVKKSEEKIRPFSETEERNQAGNSRATSVESGPSQRSSSRYDSYVTDPIQTSSHHNFKDLELRSKDPRLSPLSLRISPSKSRAPPLNSSDPSHDLKNPTKGNNQFFEALQRVHDFQKKIEFSKNNHYDIMKRRYYRDDSKNANIKEYQVQGSRAKRELPKDQALCQQIVSWDPLTFAVRFTKILVSPAQFLSNLWVYFDRLNVKTYTI